MLPLFVVAYFGGQFVGSQLRFRKLQAEKNPPR